MSERNETTGAAARLGRAQRDASARNTVRRTPATRAGRPLGMRAVMTAATARVPRIERGERVPSLGVIKAVLMQLCVFARLDTEGRVVAWPSVATIAARTQYGTTSVTGATAELERLGWVRREAVVLPVRGQTSNIYIIDLERIEGDSLIGEVTEREPAGAGPMPLFDDAAERFDRSPRGGGGGTHCGAPIERQELTTEHHHGDGAAKGDGHRAPATGNGRGDAGAAVVRSASAGVAELEAMGVTGAERLARGLTETHIAWVIQASRGKRSPAAYAAGLLRSKATPPVGAGGRAISDVDDAANRSAVIAAIDTNIGEVQAACLRASELPGLPASAAADLLASPDWITTDTSDHAARCRDWVVRRLRALGVVPGRSGSAKERAVV